MADPNEVFNDLANEYDQLETALQDLDNHQWALPSAAAGWTVGDVVAHLALTEESVVRTIRDGSPGNAALAAAADPTSTGIEAGMATDVASARLDGPTAFRRWQTARRASVEALSLADPNQTLAWAAAPLRPRTLATTRLADTGHTRSI
jgi:uncharacterized protein (TIGR03083 family)